MADKNREIAEAVVSAVGGAANITSVTHCMTRLRFVLKDQSIPNKKEIANIKGVMGTNIAGGQFQVIIGNSVGNVYKEVVAITGVSDNAGAVILSPPLPRRNFLFLPPQSGSAR